MMTRKERKTRILVLRLFPIIRKPCATRPEIPNLSRHKLAALQFLVQALDHLATPVRNMKSTAKIAQIYVST